MEELVLSDIHVAAKAPESSLTATNEKGYQVCSTKFHFFPEDQNEPQYDEDGDIVVTRRNSNENCIVIDHSMATKLVDVGLQIWPGCLLLCDYALAHPEKFEDRTVLELGAGVGMLSIMCARAAKQVIVTDIGQEVLELCSSNIKQNSHISASCPVIVRELDWLSEDLSKGGPFGWTEAEQASIQTVDVIVAADVIYDVEITEGFFAVVSKFLRAPHSKIIYIALEKRLNFTLEDLDVACKAYTHFRSCLDKLKQLAIEENLKITVDQLSNDFYQSFPQYDRNKYLELWSISTCR